MADGSFVNMRYLSAAIIPSVRIQNNIRVFLIADMAHSILFASNSAGGDAVPLVKEMCS